METRTQPDGMGSVWALLTAVDAAAVDQALTERARAAGADDPAAWTNAEPTPWSS